MSNQTPRQGNMNDQPQNRQNQQRTPNNRRDNHYERREGQTPPVGNPQRVQTGDDAATNRNFSSRRRQKLGNEGQAQQTQHQERPPVQQKRIEVRQDIRSATKVDEKAEQIPDNKSESHNDRNQRFKPRAEQPRTRIKREETVADIRADIVLVEKDIELEIKQIQAIKLGL